MGQKGFRKELALRDMWAFGGKGKGGIGIGVGSKTARAEEATYGQLLEAVGRRRQRATGDHGGRQQSPQGKKSENVEAEDKGDIPEKHHIYQRVIGLTFF